MLATRTVAGLDIFRPPVVRVHEIPVTETTTQRRIYAPAMSFPQQVTVQQAIDALRQMPSENDCIYYLFVTDYEEHLVGVVSLRQLVVAPPGARLFELMDRRQITLPYDATLAEQVQLMSETGLMALPIVDEDGKLVGALDTNQLIAAVKDETTEALYHLNGVNKKETLESTLFNTVGSRIGWLLLHVVSLGILAWLISFFEGTLTHIALLAAFIPLILGQGRSAGMQTLTFTVRSLMVGTIRRSNVQKVLRHELLVGVANGLVIGLVVAFAGWLWQDNSILGLVAGVAAGGALLMGTIAGVVVPLLLKAFHANPSRGASLLVTGVTHLTALSLFFGVSTWMIQLGYL